LANIRVIFDKKSEQAGRNVKNACIATIFRISGYFKIREEQGALFRAITDRPFSELGSGGAAKMVGVYFVEISRIWPKCPGPNSFGRTAA
jgi:hypothetical protein